MNERLQRYLELISITIVAGAIWLLVLPWIGSWESVENHLELLESRRIDASAMFYTELEDRP